MNENENFVTENEQDKVAQQDVAENVEQTTEQTPPPVKTFTQEEVNEIVGRSKARLEKKLRNEYDRRFGGLTEVLEAGTGKKTVEEQTEAFRNYYESKGIEIKKKTQEYSARDLETLAKADADEIISGGYEDVVDEVDRLEELGVENMTAREKAVFRVLAEHRKAAEKANKLAAIGVDKEVYNSTEFVEFQKMFAADTPIEKVYETFAKLQPKKEIQTMGSVKNTTTDQNAVKDYYSYEESLKFTKKDFDKNPELFKAVERSMRKWGK